jgi:CheY-like chemotaxis protein
MSDHRILVVDDEQPIADLFARWLEDEYDVRVAYSGGEALASLDDSLDVVLLDRDMPDMSGDGVLDTIRSRGIDCRVGMVTAVEPDFDVLTLGYDAYVVKPVTKPSELHAGDPRSTNRPVRTGRPRGVPITHHRNTESERVAFDDVGGNERRRVGQGTDH